MSSREESPLRGYQPKHNSTTNNVVHPVDIERSRYAPPPLPPPPPMGDHRRGGQSKHFKTWFPWLIPTIVVVNTVMFGITMYVNNCPENSVSCIAPSLGRFAFQPYKENPLFGPASPALEKMGALDVNKVVKQHQGWRLISCIWLHGGVLHILANMISLLIIGLRMEREFGWVKIGAVYMIAGIGGSLLSALFLRSNISVGASGALFGLLGAMLSELITNWSTYTNKVASIVMLLFIIVINLGVGILPHVDNFAHVGGFVSGFLLGFVFLIQPQYGWVSQRYMTSGGSPAAKSKYKIYQGAFWIISLVLLIVGLGVGLILLFKGVNGNDYCSWCHYLSCVPTSKWSCNSNNASCMSSQLGNQLNLTCSTNGKSSMYNLSNITDSQIQELCTQLCN